MKRTLAHLTGWRLVVLIGAPIATFAVLATAIEQLDTAILIALAAIIPAYGVGLIVAVDSARAADHLRRLIGPSGRIDIDVESLGRRLDAVDMVLASETRRPWEPTLLPLHLLEDGGQSPVLLLPGADYHLPEIVALADELESRAVPTVIAVGRAHWERTGDGLIWYDRPVYEAPTPETVPDNFAALVTMKDWAGYAPLVEAAKEAGIPTFAKVEGAQDFDDVDTNEARRPYRTADHILCQGQNDYDALKGMKRTIVGSTRLERLLWAPPANPQTELAVINLNFTYGVLTEARQLWLKTALEGCESAAIPYVISVHPAERARNPHPNTTSISASRLLRHASVLISRFSTLPFEAMARGVAFVYHNPHGERVATFSRPEGVYPVTINSEELASAVRSVPPPGDEVRKMSEPFLTRQVSIHRAGNSESRSADVVIGALG